MEWKSLDRSVLKFHLFPWCSSRAMQTHPRSETLTTHRLSESHLLVTSSPTRCNLPSLIVQATQAAKSLLLGDSASRSVFLICTIVACPNTQILPRTPLAN